MAVVMGAAGLLIVRPVLGLMNATPETERYAIEYAGIYFYGLPFMFCSYTGYTALRGVGDAPKAMYIMLFSVVLNIGLDPLFMFVFDMGVAGAALATVVSAAVAVAGGLWVLSSGRANITVSGWLHFRPRLGVMLDVLRIGAPAGVNGLLRSLSHWFVATLIATFGTVVVAAYGIAVRVMDLAITFGVGLELGSSAIVGQNLGAKQKDRAHDAVVKATLLVLALAGALGLAEFAFSRGILGLFTKDPAVLATGVGVLRFFAVIQVLIAMHIVLGSAFWGSGDTWPPTVIAAIIEWGVQIPLILVAIHVLRTNEFGVLWAMVVAVVVEVSLTYAWFRRGKWKDRVV
jgi:putative MATE family efflux protein